MSKAELGHSAQDVTAGIVDELAALPGKEERLAFLQAAITHAEGQVAAAEMQHERLTEKYDAIINAWDAKLIEAEKIVTEARANLSAFNREFQALGG